MPDGYTPGHLRALLDKIAPDVLAVEAPSNVPEPWSLAPYELWNVTQPWAEEKQVRAVPAGWNEPNYQLQLNQMFQQYQVSGKTAEYQRVEQQFQQKIAAQPATCEFVNSAAYNLLWREYHTELHDLLGAETPWESWNAKIVANIRETCRQHAGRRLAVVFGSAHCYYFVDQLSSDPKIKLISAAEFFPLTEEEVADHTQQIDYLKALRPLNFQVVTPKQLAHVEPLLKRVKEITEFAGDYQLFRGKYLLHKGDGAGALAAFDALATGAADSVAQFDGTSRLAEAARINAALALSRMGDRAKARDRLTAIVNDSDVSATTRQQAQQLLAIIPAD